MDNIDPIPATKNKLKVNKNCDLYTICFAGKNSKELVKMGQIYDHEMDRLYETFDPVTKKKTYDDEHSFISVDGATFVVRTIDILIQGE